MNLKYLVPRVPWVVCNCDNTFSCRFKIFGSQGALGTIPSHVDLKYLVPMVHWVFVIVTIPSHVDCEYLVPWCHRCF